MTGWSVATLRGVIRESENSVERYYRGIRTRCYHKMFQARWCESENAFPRYINANCDTKNCVIYLIITLVAANYTTALPGNNSLRAQFGKALIRRRSANGGDSNTEWKDCRLASVLR